MLKPKAFAVLRQFPVLKGRAQIYVMKGRAQHKNLTKTIVAYLLLVAFPAYMDLY
jgi:hypothetical protein